MLREEYKAKSGNTRYRPVMTVEEYPEARDGGGWCLACGLETDGVEPDARRYPCEGCGERLVYGFEELLIMGLVKLTEEVA